MKPRILFVDDGKTDMEFFSNVLNLYEIVHFMSPIDALDHLQKNKYQVIITDFKMPEMNSFEFVEKALELCPDAIPVVITSLHDDLSETCDKRVFAVIRKPLKARNVFDTAVKAMWEYYSLEKKDTKLFE